MRGNTVVLCAVVAGLAGFASEGFGAPEPKGGKQPPPDTVKPAWEQPVVQTVIEKAPKGLKFPKPKVRLKPSKVVERTIDRKDKAGAAFTIKLRATTAVKPAVLDYLAATLTVQRLEGATPATKLGKDELKFWRAGREELDGSRAEIQVRLSSADRTIDAADYTFVYPDAFELVRPGVIQLIDRYRDIVFTPPGRSPIDDPGIIRPLHHTGAPHGVTGRVMCGTMPVPHVAVVAGGRKAFSAADGTFVIPGPFSGTPGTVFIAYEADVPMSTAAGAPTAPMQIFDDFHFTRNDRVDATPTTVGDNSAFGDVAAGTDCWIWLNSLRALRHYFGLVGAAPPAGAVRVKRWSAVFMSAGAAPHTFYDYIVAPTDMASRNEVTAFFHEFGHLVRHSADGSRSHWDWDNVRFIYGRIHDGTQVTGKGFVFNEGWGNYWTAVVQGAIGTGVSSVAAAMGPSFIDFNEDLVGARLWRLATTPGAGTGHAFMVRVLLANPGVIHTLQQFEQRYCAMAPPGNPFCAGGAPTRAVPSCPDGYNDDGLTCRLNNILSRPSVARGPGTTLTVCPAGQEEQLGLCYPRCPAGFNPELTMCVQPCPAGYNDDGLTCHRYAHIFGSDNSACPWYDKCGLVSARGCSVCPEGYNNDGCTCRRDPHIFSQAVTHRGAGTIPIGCAPGMENLGGLCYRLCPAGMTASGLMCYGACPSGFRTDPATCYAEPNVFADDPVIPP